MNKIYHKGFIQFWLPIYRNQYKRGTYQERKDIRTNLFSNLNLSDKQKEEIWESITGNL